MLSVDWECSGGRLPWRVRAVDLISRWWGPPVSAMDVAGIVSAREQAVPPGWPWSWVTGSVPSSVEVVDGCAEDARGRRVGVRMYRPGLRGGPVRSELLPVVVYVHGGGWVLGSVAAYDPLAGYLAEALGALVVSVDYRLAPQCPAPAAALDCRTVVQWVWEQAGELGVDPDRIGVCGDSAGGNLAAVLAQELRDEAEAGVDGPRLRHQALIYPAVDAERLTPSKMARARGPILLREDLDTYLSHYLGVSEDALSAHDPRISPALGRLEGLPPTLVQTAQFDPLRDEGESYAAAMARAGVPVVCTRYRGAVHGFANFPGAVSGGFSHRVELVREIGRHLG
ncbi:acetyl esterase [Austwickia chelonae]|uniref:alpha/beta hydrolase n=1 Tax=Austwickia chelonae TaxID=100225 RepID=UPI0002E9166F|nr:alpha/beta hydrolase [Austwickia chelonae]SEW03956.1 acetyl esterase [Austwickia chelonae]